MPGAKIDQQINRQMVDSIRRILGMEPLYFLGSSEWNFPDPEELLRVDETLDFIDPPGPDPTRTMDINDRTAAGVKRSRADAREVEAFR